ncbi:MAG: DUF2798 domain-containing protein [Lachnospiraceae bacterium]
MPKTKFQNFVFTAIMAILMVYVIICYNISLNIGGMTTQVFLKAFSELVIMAPIAFVLEMFVVDKIAHYLAFRIVRPEDRQIVIILVISSMIVCIMCPTMSLVATLLYKHAGAEVVAVWLQTTALNFPMAFFLQIFFVGPFVRLLSRALFERN